MAFLPNSTFPKLSGFGWASGDVGDGGGKSTTTDEPAVDVGEGVGVDVATPLNINSGNRSAGRPMSFKLAARPPASRGVKTRLTLHFSPRASLLPRQSSLAIVKSLAAAPSILISSIASSFSPRLVSV